MLTAFSRAIIAGALLAGSVKAGDHFIISQCRELSYTRVDPLRTPGAIGPHVHNVVGGSMFSPDSTTPESLQQSKCSSTMVQDDKSIYWTPLLYYNHGNGSYSPMISSTRIYYFLKPGNGTTAVIPFPRGFRMLGGGYSDSRPQTYPPRGELSYDQRQALDPRINAIMWGCSAGAVQGQGDGGSLPGQRPYLPNDAPNGCGVVNAGMFFPSCGDGRLDSDDHFSHMTYPLDGSNGYNCPPSHPIKYPTIFIEHFYFPSADQPYRGANADNWVLANGDPTGLNMHGDFINGWNQDTLEQTLQQCNTPNAPESDLQNCAPLAKSLNVDAANTCLSEGNIANEDVGLTAPITGFPGCNPFWGWEARTKPTCATNANVALVQPSGRFTVEDFKISLPIANGTGSTSVTGPAGANSTGHDYDYYSSSSYASTATSSYSYSDASSSSYLASAPTSVSASATESVSSYEATATGEANSEDPTSSTVPASSEVPAPTSSAAPISSSSYDFEYPPASADTQSTGVPALTASSDYPAQATSTSASASTSAPVQVPGGAAAQVTSSVVNSSHSSASSASSSSSTSPANATPAAQNANTLNPVNNNGPPKTCRRKNHKAHSGSHARRHREWQRRTTH
ncbi:unnamed protein product [Rhizoctonia solani]|uniref:DUF1996 domain-containing protein n=3 Tax=Rhizoctonia solani TaxID=456999 RepID=A0A8H3C5N3_9AGAM|nr:DUF1996 domain protein [Rhizoctonia solani AG-3 Rhs1AP]KEP50732.1 DUF1996 domain protein [Rhizoctonia solani 123E]CAE6348560.1 unnamed protein product [Rhizoctonia solani]CAE6472552.1 unnamed protein product [Rhizoctonia solani]